MPDETQNPEEQKQGKKAAPAKTDAPVARRQSVSREDLERLGLDPSCYGYTREPEKAEK